MGGKTHSDNSQVVAEQQAQAADARQQETDRQARIDQGLASIDSAFSGITDPFYDSYKQASLDYYQPQVDKQYSDAQKEMTYRLGRAGTTYSSAGNTEFANLAEQDAENNASIANQADTAAGALKANTDAQKAQVTSQLYATEDPNVAASQATDAVRAISLSQPSLSPLSQLFNVAATGGARILQGFNSQSLTNQFTPNTGLPTSSGSSYTY